MIITEKECGNCYYWEYTSTKDSGIPAASGIGNWHYRIGQCNNTKKMIGTFAGQECIPEFSKFWCYEKHKVKD